LEVLHIIHLCVMTSNNDYSADVEGMYLLSNMKKEVYVMPRMTYCDKADKSVSGKGID